MTHLFNTHVYYEDTDLGGIVYYANYLRYIERARTEWVRALGVDQTRLKADSGIVFAVSRVEADYLRPARFDDDLTVATDLVTMSGARLVLKQEVRRGNDVLFRAVVTLVALSATASATGAVTRLPAELRRMLGSRLAEM